MLLGWLRILTPLDRRLLLLVSVVVVLSFPLVLQQEEGARVIISSDQRVVFVASLAEPQRAELNGPLGKTVIEIANGGVRVLSSPCRQQVCVRMGEARHAGDLIACVPNHLVIDIKGKQGGAGKDYDLISR